MRGRDHSILAKVFLSCVFLLPTSAAALLNVTLQAVVRNWSLPEEHWLGGEDVELVGTDLFLRRSDHIRSYTVTMSIGSPPARVELLVDTGSSDLVVCQTSSYSPSKNVDERLAVNSVVISYLSGTVFGSELADDVCLDKWCVPQQSFVFANQGNLVKVDGIVGLAFPPASALRGRSTFLQSLIARQGLRQPAFRLSLEADGGLLSVGELQELVPKKDASKYVALPLYTGASAGASLWTVTASVHVQGLPGSVEVLGTIDSGTSLIVIPEDHYDTLVTRGLLRNITTECSWVSCPCDAPLPDLVLSFGEGSGKWITIRLTASNGLISTLRWNNNFIFQERECGLGLIKGHTGSFSAMPVRMLRLCFILESLTVISVVAVLAYQLRVTLKEGLTLEQPSRRRLLVLMVVAAFIAAVTLGVRRSVTLTRPGWVLGDVFLSNADIVHDVGGYRSLIAKKSTPHRHEVTDDDEIYLYVPVILAIGGTATATAAWACYHRLDTVSEGATQYISITDLEDP